MLYIESRVPSPVLLLREGCVNAIYPAHIACRGFEHKLPTRWILDSIEQALRTGKARRPGYTVWPSGDPLIVTITEAHLGMWREQYEAGARADLPEGLLEDIDRVLGVSRPSTPDPGLTHNEPDKV